MRVGIGLADVGGLVVVKQIDDDSQAHALGVPLGCALCKVNGEDISGLSARAARDMVAVASRPLCVHVRVL